MRARRHVRLGSACNFGALMKLECTSRPLTSTFSIVRCIDFSPSAPSFVKCTELCEAHRVLLTPPNYVGRINPLAGLEMLNNERSLAAMRLHWDVRTNWASLRNEGILPKDGARHVDESSLCRYQFVDDRIVAHVARKGTIPMRFLIGMVLGSQRGNRG